jgi:hypothetical protein
MTWILPREASRALCAFTRGSSLIAGHGYCPVIIIGVALENIDGAELGLSA